MSSYDQPNSTDSSNISSSLIFDQETLQKKLGSPFEADHWIYSVSLKDHFGLPLGSITSMHERKRFSTAGSPSLSSFQLPSVNSLSPLISPVNSLLNSQDPLKSSSSNSISSISSDSSLIPSNPPCQHPVLLPPLPVLLPGSLTTKPEQVDKIQAFCFLTSVSQTLSSVRTEFSCIPDTDTQPQISNFTEDDESFYTIIDRNNFSSSSNSLSSSSSSSSINKSTNIDPIEEKEKRKDQEEDEEGYSLEREKKEDKVKFIEEVEKFEKFEWIEDEFMSIDERMEQEERQQLEYLSPYYHISPPHSLLKLDNNPFLYSQRNPIQTSIGKQVLKLISTSSSTRQSHTSNSIQRSPSNQEFLEYDRHFSLKIYPNHPLQNSFSYSSRLQNSVSGQVNSSTVNTKEMDRWGFYLYDESAVQDSRKQKEKEEDRLPKWKQMISQWNTYSHEKKIKVKRRCRKGCPDTIRGELWKRFLHLDETPFLLKATYEELLKKKSEYEEIIHYDCLNTFRNNIRFQNTDSPLWKSLFRVLKAYSLFDSDIGYCYGMNYIAATFLLYMSERESFGMLHRLLKSNIYRLNGMYLPGNPLLYELLYIHDQFLDASMPKLNSHLKMNNIIPVMYAGEWYSTLFVNCLPFRYVVRIWDVMFSEGLRILIRVGLAILGHLQNELLKSNSEQILLKLESFKDVSSNQTPSSSSSSIQSNSINLTNSQSFDKINSTQSQLNIGVDELIKMAVEFNLSAKKIEKLEREYHLIN